MANEFIARRGLIVLAGGASVTGTLRSDVDSASFFSGNGAGIVGVISSSYAVTASYALVVAGGTVSSSYALTSSFAQNALTANSASFATTASAATSITFLPASASYAATDWGAINNKPVGILSGSAQINLLTGVTASYASTSFNATSASYAGTDWGAINNKPVGILSGSAQINLLTGVTASYASTSFNATSASYAGTDWGAINNKPVGILSGSAQINLLTGVTASYASKSFTADSATTATSASYALTSSFAQNALTANSATSASYALTSSFAQNALTANSASFATTASAATSITFLPASASYAGTDWGAINNKPLGILSGSAQINLLIGVTASYASKSFTADSATTATSASYALTSSFAQNALTANSASYAGTDWGAINNKPIGILSGSAQINLLSGVTASYASRSLSASYAGTDWGAINNIPIGIVTSSAQTVALIAGQNINPGVVSASSIWVTGDITARQFNTQLISSSIIYQSGSTKFGDTSDDVMSVTGSIQLSGSANLVGPVIIGNLNAPTINGVTFTTSSTVVNVGTTVITTLPTGTLDTARFEYIAKSGSSARGGTIIAVWSASVAEFTDTSTNDIGTTTDISFQVDVVNSLRLKAVVVNSNTWTVKTYASAI